MTNEQAFAIVKEELLEAMQRFGPFKSTHEGWAVIKEEVDELWDDIKRREPNKQCEIEAKQVAAMAIRFLIDCC